MPRNDDDNDNNNKKKRAKTTNTLVALDLSGNLRTCSRCHQTDALDQFVDKRYSYLPGNVRFTTSCHGCRMGKGGSTSSPDVNPSILELQLWLAGREAGAGAGVGAEAQARPRVRPEGPLNNDAYTNGPQDSALAGGLVDDGEVSCRCLPVLGCTMPT